MLPSPADCQGGPVRGGSLNTGLVSDPPSFDSHSDPTARFRSHTGAVFSGLVRTDPMKEEVTLKTIIPDLAASWTVSPDKKVYTFNLRKGVKSHDGHPFIGGRQVQPGQIPGPEAERVCPECELIDKVEATERSTR